MFCDRLDLMGAREANLSHVISDIFLTTLSTEIFSSHYIDCNISDLYSFALVQFFMCHQLWRSGSVPM